MDYPGNGDFRGRREASVWQQLNRVLRVLLCLAFALVVISLFVPQQRRLASSRSEIDKLQTQVLTERTSLKRQNREIALLRTDPEFLENFARDRLDMMKPGEFVFHVEAPKHK